MKTCFKCNLALPRTEFYAHPMMGDGLLGKCKDCTKADVAQRIARVQQQPEWVAMERARCREKSARTRRAGGTPPKTAQTKLSAAVAQRKWSLANPHKRRAQRAAAVAVRCGKLIPLGNCEDCGNKTKLQKHHADYSKPLSVEWLCSKCHGKRHRKD